MKQVILMRTDLGMSTGKMCAQAAHAAVDAVEDSVRNVVEFWNSQGSPKIILKVGSEKELRDLVWKAAQKRLIISLIHDAGRTELPAGTATAGAIGPAEDNVIDKITGQLPLL